MAMALQCLMHCAPQKSRSNVTRLSIFLGLATATCYYLLFGFSNVQCNAHGSATVHISHDKCSTPTDPTVTASKANVWDGFTEDEMQGLFTWLHDSRQGLNLTINEKAGPWDNAVMLTELLHPNKTDALTYLDGHGPRPTRYARIVVSVGATDEPYLQEYSVGPVPVSAATTITPLTYIYNKGTSKTPNYGADSRKRLFWLATIGSELADITTDILGTVYMGKANDTSTIWGKDPLLQENGRIVQWVQYWVGGHEVGGRDAMTLRPQGLYLKLDLTGRRPDDWKLLMILYDDIVYESVASFRAAWKKPDFNKLTKVIDGAWTTTQQTGESLPYDSRAPPISIQPEGRRYAVDKSAKYVEWMGFTFYIGFSRDCGIALYDIKYKGQRILYELGLQEAIAHYAGNDPIQSGAAYLDGHYGFGPYIFRLVPGYDCPGYSTFLDNELHENGETTTHNSSVCLFEQDAGYPLQRHTTASWVSVTRNTIFTVRSVATVGNYDYNFDYIFYLDGTIEVKVRASGYIQSAFYAHNGDYGYKIHEAMSGSMHDHIMNFKADFDILGGKNSFERVDVVSKTVDYIWSSTPRNTMQIERSFIQTEEEAKINWPMNGQGIYVIVNKDTPNIHGEFPGYRIMPGSGTPVHLAIKNSSDYLNAAEFGTHHLYVTKRKDTEPRSAAAANMMTPADPLVNFGKFFDGESLIQEDIVVWFNLGMHHVPHTGDLPNTVFTTAQSSVFFSPHNYLLGDASRQTSQQAQVDFSSTEGVKVNTFGSKPPTCDAKLAQLYPDLSSYEGGHKVREFPYHSAPR